MASRLCLVALMVGCSASPPGIAAGIQADAASCDSGGAAHEAGAAGDPSEPPMRFAGGSPVVLDGTGGTLPVASAGESAGTAGAEGLGVTNGGRPGAAGSGPTAASGGVDDGPGGSSGRGGSGGATGGSPSTGGSSTGGATTGGDQATGGSEPTGGSDATGGSPEERLTLDVDVPCETLNNQQLAYGNIGFSGVGLCILHSAIWVPDPTWNGSGEWNFCNPEGTWARPDWTTEPAASASCDHDRLLAQCCSYFGLVRFSVTLVNPSRE
jgi:hypothetical protein